MKRYIAKTNIAINVILDSGNSRHISFDPVSGSNISIYYTDNENIQKALERHHMFGKMFSVDEEFEQQPAVEADEGSAEAAQPDSLRKIEVTDLDEAKDYLSENFNYTRTKLARAGKAGVIKAAEQNGIVFVGLDD